MKEGEIHDQSLAPGDEAAPGTPGAAYNVCPMCQGSGTLGSGVVCPTCDGSGNVVEGIGGA